MSGLIETLPEVEGVLTPNRAMADLSWLRCGGAAEVLFQPAHMADIAVLMKGLPADVPVMPVGVCSNLIIRDGGIRGVVVRLGRGFNGFEVLKGGQVRVGASALDAHVAKKAAAEGLDLTFLRTIPGNIGGAIKMNAGCYGRYMSDVFVRATAVARDGSIVTLKRNDLNFAYRSTSLPDDMVITQAILQAEVGDPEALSAKMDEQLAKREASQPTKERSCGSTFRNPAGFSSTGQADDTHELKAWKVIDDSGMRGARVGGAQMSEMHSNFMINTGGASAADLENLGELVIKKVFEHSGIVLEWEIKRVGEPA